MLTLYRRALAARRSSPALGRGVLSWVSAAESAEERLSFDMVGDGTTVLVVLNLSADPIPLPEGEVLLSSEPVDAGQMPGVSAAWIARAT